MEIDEDGSTATPKVVFPYVKSGKIGSNTAATRPEESASPPPTAATNRLQLQHQPTNRIWPASPAKLLAPVK